LQNAQDQSHHATTACPSATWSRTSTGIVDGISPPDLHVDLRAEMDMVVVISNGAQINSPCDGFNQTPVRMVVAG